MKLLVKSGNFWMLLVITKRLVVEVVCVIFSPRSPNFLEAIEPQARIRQIL